MFHLPIGLIIDTKTRTIYTEDGFRKYVTENFNEFAEDFNEYLGEVYNPIEIFELSEDDKKTTKEEFISDIVELPERYNSNWIKLSNCKVEFGENESYTDFI